MAKLPLVAIIGRPNAGKSTLFNRLIGKRQAIVSEIPGTTRDQVTSRVEGERVSYLLIDTGGMGGGSTDTDFEDDVHAQSQLALEHSDLILFVIDGKEELTASDRVVADLLRKKRKRHVPVFLVIAKCDTEKRAEEARTRFYELGVAEEIFTVSAIQNLGIEELRDVIERKLREMHFGKARPGTAVATAVPRIAIVGRPNTGKSSLVNALMPDEERRISARLTGPLPGTTRDATDTVIRSEMREYVFVDTAGLRKQGKVEHYSLEAFAVLRALQAIGEADVTVLVLDPTQGFGKQDKHIAGITLEEGTGLILLINKADLLPSEQREEVRRSLPSFFPFCRWAPVLLTSAVTRENLPNLFSLVDAVSENRKRRLEDATFNRMLRDLSSEHPALAGKGFPFTSASQVDVCPPTFELILRDPKRLHASELRFLENRLRKLYSFEGTPIRWIKLSSVSPE